ncbi:MAG: Methyltransferase type 12 [uncultured Sulfurovum sp.]|uniref:Methyltransferase type 12 n=1 Tax=uncultured Sulfurovum sp. TaxID=269237 RepID=A0A6S6T4M7_9BACT|nr:MAG: Methyltransferase type 12 [uncultured Sulfurovum sp.]
MDNCSNSLDLYAKVEDLLGVQEAAPSLYAYYFLFLNSIQFKTLLDVGCGSGGFLLQMQTALDIPKVKGIDLSPLMVSKTSELSIDAECIDLCLLEGQYDVITAVFDMLNYLDSRQLQTFLICVKDHLNDGGVFLCDINTLYGFEHVAVGSYIVDDETRFLTVDSDFKDTEYISEFTLFDKEDSHFKKSQETIRQYYYTVDMIIEQSGLTCIETDDINLYGLEKPDKKFIVLKKV